jgi:homoserine dehydrogenase
MTTAITTSTTTQQRTIRIGLLGHGTVGSAFSRLVRDKRDSIARSHGVSIRIDRVLARTRRRGVTADVAAFLEGDYDCVVETLGGLEPARTLVSQFLKRGVPVVTANKALLAEHGRELRAHGTSLRGEAAIGAAIPLMGVLERSLQGATVRRITAILNGTSNFVLTRMAQENIRLGEAVEQAQQLGFAEADPSLDLAGTDAAHKLRILVETLTGTAPHIETTGLAGIRHSDTQRAGYVLKPIAHVGSGAFVAPTYVPRTHPLAAVDDELNGIVLQTDIAGTLTFSGPGAGGLATASALLDDLLATQEGAPRHGTLDCGSCATDWFVALELLADAPVLAVARDAGVPIREWHERDRGFHLRTGPLNQTELDSFLSLLRPLRALERASAYRILEN